jgi:hypothetical protein
MSLFFTKCFLNTPAAFNAVRECFSVNASMYSPFRDAFCLAIKRQQVLSTKIYSLSQAAFVRPSPAQTCSKSVLVYSEMASPICDAHCLSHVRKKLVAALVAALLSNRRPVAIGWPVVCDAFRTLSARIIAIIVSSFDAVLRSGPIPHVIVKCLKRLPVLTNADVATTVSIETSRCRVVTALVNVLPGPVLWCARHAVRLGALRDGFFTKAPAAFRVPRAKTATLHNRSCSAVTLAMPKRFSEFVETSIGQNSPATEVIAPGQVFHAARNSNRIIFSHDASLISQLVRATQRVMTVGLLAFYRVFAAEPSGKWR